MPFEVFGAIAPARKPIFEPREDGRTFPFGALEVRLDVVDVHQDAIDHPRNCRPSPGAFTGFAMPAWTFVIRRGRGQHDQTIARFHLAVRETPIFPKHPRAFTKSEHARQPVERGHAVFVRNHRHD